MRERIATLFERWGVIVAAHPWSVLIVPLAFTAALATQLPNIVVDTSTEGFLKPTDPALVTYDEFRAQFGRDDAILLAVDTPTVFDLAFLDRLRAFHDELEAELPSLDEITSLVNARAVYGKEDELVVEDLMAEWPKDEDDVARLRERVYANPLYLNALIAADARMTTIQIDLDTYVQTGIDADGNPTKRSLGGEELEEVVSTVDRLIAKYDVPGFRIHAAGTSYMVTNLARTLMSDTRRLVAGVVSVIGMLLLLLFGRLRAPLLALLVVVLSVICTMGTMVLLGMTYQAPTQVVPISLLAIGIGDSVHILAIYYQRRRRGDDKSVSIAGTLRDTGPAVLMTSLTTAGAMMSFTTANLAPIANIGVLVPIGVMIALAMTLTILPALLAILPERDGSLPTPRRLAMTDWLVVGAGTWSARHPWPIIATTAAVTVVMIAAAAQLRIAHNPLVWFPSDDHVRVGTETINDRMGGVVTIEALFDTGRENGVHAPELLRTLERIAQRNADLVTGGEEGRARISIGKTTSVADLVKEVNRALNENQQAEYRLPDTSETVAQELLLFELSGNDDLEDLTDYQYTTARMSMRVPWVDATAYGEFLTLLRAALDEETDRAVKLTLTGRMPILFQTFEQVLSSMIRSYGFAFAAVTPLMIILLGRVRMGLLAMIPNMLPMLSALAIMGFNDLPLDAFSLLSGSIILGLAVDDTIHFMHGFRSRYDAHGDVHRAVRETLATTGQALLFTTLILCAGFSVYILAYMRAPSVFGVVTACALAVAFMADIVLGPALVALAVGRERWAGPSLRSPVAPPSATPFL